MDFRTHIKEEVMDIGVSHLLEASVKLGCTVETNARALILYHHFMRCVDEVHYDASMVAAVALGLSGRIHEQVIDIDSLLCVFYSVVSKTTEVLSPDDVAFVLLRKSLISIDFLMQRMLEFNLNHRLAHQYLVPFLTFIFERCKNISEFRNELSNSCIRILSDFYTTRNCLIYQPEHIAIACIDLSLYIHGMINDVVLIKYLVPFLTFIFERCKNISEFRNELSNSCIRILSDFYTTRNCLIYQPEHIAIACIDLSLYIHGMINDVVLIPVWYQGFCNDLTVEKVREIKGDMMALYRDSTPIPKKKVLQKI